VHIDPDRQAFGPPLATLVGKVADNLFLLGVDARWAPLQVAPLLLTYEQDWRLLEGWQPAG
jgi:hypothetical protein